MLVLDLLPLLVLDLLPLLVRDFDGAAVGAVVGAAPQVAGRVVMFASTHSDDVLQQSFMPAGIELFVAAAALEQVL